MNRCQRISGALVLAAAFALSATACSPFGGSSSPSSAGTPSTSPSPTALSADALANQAVADLGQASAYRMKGRIDQAGKIIGVDLSVVTGKGCVGSISQAGKGTIRLVLLGQKLWIRPNVSFWESVGAPSSTARALAAKYVATSATSAKFGAFGKLCDAQALTKGFGTATGLARGATTTVDGVSAVTLKEADGVLDYVTESGRPELVRLLKPAKGSAKVASQIDFLDFGKPATITAPPASQTIPGAKLGA
ncbi:hypothetical protein [Streptacidiphilus jiangxiensis]|uniref:Lipoprotein LprG n=1 Tax=Streptacidiphilus jiangxiensis TaxID=235985 RepID=A0A1H7FZF6_STRJI|nr:hypothetical protein [Streptacidiphilus jiangxiensis]SEK29892.1 hypothetical protein SAMN05414137_101418 [Streptacidiphilus jiangxiensis]